MVMILPCCVVAYPLAFVEIEDEAVEIGGRKKDLTAALPPCVWVCKNLPPPRVSLKIDIVKARLPAKV